MLGELHSGYVFRLDLSIAPQGCLERTVKEGGSWVGRRERERGEEVRKEEIMEVGPRDNSVFPRMSGPAAGPGAPVGTTLLPAELQPEGLDEGVVEEGDLFLSWFFFYCLDSASDWT